MKIAFIGTHGVGKTILCLDFASLLKKHNYTVSIIAEVTREAVKQGLPINEETTVAAQGWILLSQMAKEIEAEHESEYVICDRSVIDNYIYMLAKFESEKFYEKMVLEWTKIHNYDFFFKVPISNKDITKDGVRSTNIQFQKKIDSLLDEFLEKNNIEHIKIPLIENQNEWLEFVKNKVIKQKFLDEF